MGTQIKLTAADGHQLDAYFAASSGPARGAIVLLQEIFGVNSHIRSVADDYAAQGFHVVAPALFDRVQRNLELGYTSPDAAQGMKVARQIGLDIALKDVAASIGHARAQWADLKVGVVGIVMAVVWPGSQLPGWVLPRPCAITADRSRQTPRRCRAAPS